MIHHELFSLAGKVAVVTGGTGVLGGALARGLAAAGAVVGILGRSEEKAAHTIDAIGAAGGQAFPMLVDVLDKAALLSARASVIRHVKRIDILINAAGGNIPAATIVGENSFFTLTQEAYENVL